MIWRVIQLVWALGLLGFTMDGYYAHVVLKQPSAHHFCMEDQLDRILSR